MTTVALLLVGCGKMGSALLNRWKNVAAIGHFHVIDPHHEQTSDERITWHQSIDSIPADYAPNVIVFAVKPQQLEEALPQFRTRFGGINPLYISVAAGKKLSFYLEHLGEKAHIVRAMPNTPAIAGYGMSALCGPAHLPDYGQKIAMALMETVGKAEWLADETLMDAVTAVSGCGPAYMFLFFESLIKAGIDLGLPDTMSRSLVVQTIIGSLALTEQSGKTLEELRIQVASPGGATEAALNVLMADDALLNLLKKATAAAKTRSEELS